MTESSITKPMSSARIAKACVELTIRKLSRSEKFRRDFVEPIVIST